MRKVAPKTLQALAALGVLMLPCAAFADTGRVDIKNTSNEDIFVTVTDDLSPDPTPRRIRVNAAETVQVKVQLDGEGHYKISWTSTDAAQQTRTASGSCSNLPMVLFPCEVDLVGGSPGP